MINLQEIVDSLKTHFEDEKTKVETFLGQHLPGLADLAQQLAANPAVAALAGAVHLNDAPELLESFSQEVQRIDAALATAKAAGHAQGKAEAEAAASAQAEQAS